jgi:hypothetical protein
MRSFTGRMIGVTCRSPRLAPWFGVGDTNRRPKRPAGAHAGRQARPSGSGRPTTRPLGPVGHAARAGMVTQPGVYQADTRETGRRRCSRSRSGGVPDRPVWCSDSQIPLQTGNGVSRVENGEHRIDRESSNAICRAFHARCMPYPFQIVQGTDRFRWPIHSRTLA